MKTCTKTLLAVLLIGGLLGSTLLAQTPPQRPGVASPAPGNQTQSVPLGKVNSIGAPIGQNSLASVPSGGDRLVAMQNTDGGWGWELTGSSAPNTVGPIAMGLAQVYQQTESATQLAALQKAGAFLLTKTNNFSPSDGYLAAQLDKIFAVTTYTSHVRTNFYDKLAAGTYDRSGTGTLLTTETYIQLVRNGRAGDQANLAAWDIGIGLVGAASAGASTTEWIAGVEAEINELDGTKYYDVVGLAGAVYGLAFVHVDFDPTAGQHAAASSTNDLATILASYQITSGAGAGGFAWNSAWVIPNDQDEAVQETGYSILALNEVNRATYLTQIQQAGNYLKSVQLGTGGWRNYEGSSSFENNEVTAEALWGISTAFLPVHNLTQNTYFLSLKGAVGAAVAGNTLEIAAGTYPLASRVDVNKANITIQGVGSALTILQTSGGDNCFSILASGVTLQNLQIQKTDKTTQAIIQLVNGNNVTIKNNIIRGQFTIGDDEVARAMVFNAGLFSGVNIEGNTIYALRQPAYISGTHTGTIQGNYVYGTKGWVVEGGNLSFTGNTWGTGANANVYDIAILSWVGPGPYSDIVAMSNANNDAVIEDQRVSPAVLSVVYVDASTSYSSDLGGKFHPYATIPPAVTRVVAGGKIYVAPGTYSDAVSITKLLTLDGAGSGSDPASNTVVSGPGSGTGITTVAGASAGVRVVIKDLNVRNWLTGIIANSFLTLDNVASEVNANQGLELPPLQDLVITNSKFNSNFLGMRAGTAANVENVTITNSQFNNNAAQGWFIAMGGAANSSTFSNVHVTNCTFNNNLQKGIYVEKLEEAVFDGITVTNSGTDPTYGFNTGIDINLKYGTYQNIQLINSTITGCGITGTATDTFNPVAVGIKARDDAPSYNSNPATLDNVLINNCTISGPENALRLGEFNKVNLSPTNVVVSNTTLSGNGAGKYHVVNKTSASITANSGNTFTGSSTIPQIEAKIFHKLDDPSLGVVNYGQFAVVPSEVWVDDGWLGTTPGQPVGGHWFGTDAFATIQAGVDAVVAAGTVHVAAGSYAEAVTVNKTNLTIIGGGAATTTINPGNTLLDVATLSAAGLKISGFTLTGGKNGIYGTTASGKLTGLTITGNAENGMNLIDADFNLVQGNTISGHASGTGILLSGSKQNTISGNTISGNNYNVMVAINGTRTARGNMIQGNSLLTPGTWSVRVMNEATSTQVNFNIFNSTPVYTRYISNEATGSLNARYNWFDAQVTPLASGFNGTIDRSNNYATSPTVAIFPISYYMPTGSTVNLSVMGLIPAGTKVLGSDIKMNWTNNASIHPVGDPLEGSFFLPPVGDSFFEVFTTAGSSIRVNQSILTQDGVGNPLGGLPYLGVLFTTTFEATADGASNVTLSPVSLRDQNNAPLTVVTDPTGGITLTADGTSPAVTDVVVHNLTLGTDKTGDGKDDYVKHSDHVNVTATVSDANGLTAADITADLRGFHGGNVAFSAVNPTDYTGTLATWDISGITCSPADAAINTVVSATDVVGNTAVASGSITADNTAPASIAGFTAAPGKAKTILAWTNPGSGDVTLKKILVRFAKWDAYPHYSTTAPAFPADKSAGTGTAADLDNSIATYNHIFAPSERGVFYYRAFAYDWAGNYSTADGSEGDADRSTNYVLGDVGSGSSTIPGSGGYDNFVSFFDLMQFSTAYFSSSPTWNGVVNGDQLDFGPTVAKKGVSAGSRIGIPQPSGTVEFEDLMIFSMNYQRSFPKVSPSANSALAQEFSMGLRSRSLNAEELVATIHLGNDGRSVKGTAAELTFDPAVLAVSGIDKGDLFGGEGQGFYGYRKSEGKLRIEAAVLGEGLAVEQSGDVATVHFRVLKSGDPKLVLADATVRNAANASQQITLKTQAVELPTTFDLSQNYPNPFNPTTVIKYQLPSPVAVDVAVYNVLGEKVATLVNEIQAAGYYSIEWNGRDSRNTQVSTGMYIYTMKAGEFSSVKKMMLVK